MVRSFTSTNRQVVAALTLALALLTMSFVFASSPANADILLNQCNGVDNVGGEALECTYTVTNNIADGVTSSTTTLTSCHGAANDPSTMVCTTSTTDSVELVTSITQCNGSGNGGGGQVTCHVDVLNNIVGTEVASAATVNQCNASGTGGGTEPTILCNPYPANTTNATVTQCNESGQGGGGTVRVQCSVDSNSTTTAGLTVTVNQCIGSGNEGGATVTCDTAIINNITAAPDDDDETPVPVPDDGEDVPDIDEGTPDRPDLPTEDEPDGPGTPENPATPDSPPAPRGPTGGTTSQITRVPSGGAATGGGLENDGYQTRLIALGLLLSMAGAYALVVRKRSSTSL